MCFSFPDYQWKTSNSRGRLYDQVNKCNSQITQPQCVRNTYDLSTSTAPKIINLTTTTTTKKRGGRITSQPNKLDTRLHVKE